MMTTGMILHRNFMEIIMKDNNRRKSEILNCKSGPR